jgi:hypothetical protein
MRPATFSLRCTTGSLKGFGTLDLSVTRLAGVMSRLFLVGRVLGLKQVPATDPKGGPRRLSGLLIYVALTDWPRRGTDDPGGRAGASCKYAQFVTLKTQLQRVQADLQQPARRLRFVASSTAISPARVLSHPPVDPSNSRAQDGGERDEEQRI